MILIFALILTIPFDCLAIQSKTDNQRSRVKRELNRSLELMDAEKYEEARNNLDSLYAKAISENDSFLISGTLGNLGYLTYELGNFQESILFYEQSLNIDFLLGDSINAAGNLRAIGICNKQLGRFDNALSYYQDALDIVLQLNLTREEASIANSIGNLYHEIERYELSYEYISQAQRIWQELSDSTRSSYALSNMGNALLGLGRTDDAIEAYNRSLELKHLVGTNSSIAITLSNLGEAYFKRKQFAEAREYYLKSLRLREEAGQTNRVAIVCHNLANLELDQNNYTKAQNWLDKASGIIEETESQDNRLENLKIQKILYERVGQFKKALKTDSAYDQLRQVIFDKQVVNVQKLQYEFDLERKDQERERIQTRLDLVAAESRAQKARSQIQILIIIVTILAVVIISYFAYSLRKKNRHIENLIRELHHRVKNHLGMISGLFGAQTGLSMADSAVLDEAKMRVEAVQGIHRRLFLDEYEFVNMQEYLEELVDNNALVFGLFNRIDKQMVIREQVLEIDKALSVGLIANEVLTNAFKAFKYGIQETKKPVLRIVLERAVKGYKTKGYKMIIFNNASTNASTDKSSGGGFGGELISRLAQNLKGHIRIIKEGGFQFELTFP